MAGIAGMLHIDTIARHAGGRAVTEQGGNKQLIKQARGGQRTNVGKFDYAQVGGSKNSVLHAVNAVFEKVVRPAQAAGVSTPNQTIKRKPEALSKLYGTLEQGGYRWNVKQDDLALLTNFRRSVGGGAYGEYPFGLLNEGRTKAYAIADEFKLTGDARADMDSGEMALGNLVKGRAELMRELAPYVPGSTPEAMVKDPRFDFDRAPREVVLAKLAKAGIYHDAVANRLHQVSLDAEALAKKMEAIIEEGGRGLESLKSE